MGGCCCDVVFSVCHGLGFERGVVVQFASENCRCEQNCSYNGGGDETGFLFEGFDVYYMKP
jgi:hypothetical protein